MLLALLPTQGLLYLFQVTEQRLTKNLLQGALTTEECQEGFGRSCAEFAEEDGAVRVALATLAMGDNAAVEFAQGAHLGVLYRHGVVSADELLVPNFPPPRGLLSIGVVLDDLVILEKVTRALGQPPKRSCSPGAGGGGEGRGGEGKEAQNLKPKPTQP